MLCSITEHLTSPPVPPLQLKTVSAPERVSSYIGKNTYMDARDVIKGPRSNFHGRPELA